MSEEVPGVSLWTRLGEQYPCCPPKSREPHGTENGSLEEGPALSFSDCFPGIFQVLQRLRGNASVLWSSTSAPTLGQSLHRAQAREQNSFLIWNPACGGDCFTSGGKPYCEDGYRKEVFVREEK